MTTPHSTLFSHAPVSLHLCGRLTPFTRETTILKPSQDLSPLFTLPWSSFLSTQADGPRPPRCICCGLYIPRLLLSAGCAAMLLFWFQWFSPYSSEPIKKMGSEAN